MQSDVLSAARILVAIAVLAFSALTPASAQQAAVYNSPEEAVAALVDTIKSAEPANALLKVFGAAGRDVVQSGDDVEDEARRTRFLSAYTEAHALQEAGDGKMKLIVGKDEYPFPIPIVKAGDKWQWDVEAGQDELLTRRIGENELAALKVMQAYVAAQLEYAEQPRDGKGVQYARRLMSREGRKDGLYWETAEGEPQSPIGPLVAKAQSEGYKGRAQRADGQTGYHGYLYRMLYSQGKNAAGGSRDYIVNDRMIGGFALIAVPAQYGNSGVMTFIVNQDGVIYEKDLGPDTAAAAQRITRFDPDSSWRKVTPD